MLKGLLRAVGLSLLLFQSSCTVLRYLPQAAAGQDDLNRRARDIDDLIREERVDGRLRRLLSQVPLIKQFGERHGLRATKNYRRYVRVDGPAVVWVVSAAEPLRFKNKSWGFPLVGSFTYLGWFKKDEASRFADELRAEGWDVDLRGANAYSTEGYFEDAVLSSMIPRGKEALGELANVILHESTHATFFVRNQSTLNESVARFAGDKLAEAYVKETLGEDAAETVAYLAAEEASKKRGRAMREALVALDTLYNSSLPAAEKLAEKRARLDALRASLRFRRPITNATLLQYKTYNSGQEELDALYVECGGDWPRFLKSLKTLERKHFEKGQESDIGLLVAPLVAAHCPQTL